MKAITVRLPWAACIASHTSGAKRVENRGAGTAYRGALLIHAGKEVDTPADADLRVVGLLGVDASAGRPLGAVIAVANLVDVHGRSPMGCCKPWGEDWHHGPRSNKWAVHLVLAPEVQVLERPVYCRGALGLWTPPADVVEQVERQLTKAGAR